MKFTKRTAGLARSRGIALSALLLLPVLLLALPWMQKQWDSKEYQRLVTADAGRIARLIEIAEGLQEPKAQHAELLREAAQKCGFEIWTDNREKVAPAIGSTPLNLAITEGEIRCYAAMFKRGDRVQLKNLVAAIDVVWNGVGMDGSTGPAIQRFLTAGPTEDHGSVRALVIFLNTLDYHHENVEAPLPDLNAELDPIQALFLLRLVTEDIANPIKDALKKGKPLAEVPINEHGRAPSDEIVTGNDGFSESQAPTIPGWAGDAWSGGYTALTGQLVTLLTSETGIAQTLRNYSDRIGRAQGILSIIKFIATYIMMKGDITVEPPGAPLVRNKNTQPGEKRTLVAHFRIDGTALTDWLKDNRGYIATLGLDVDMPRTGDMAGIETSWRAGDGGTGDPGDLIQVVGANPDRVVTDAGGKAKVVWEGVARRRALDPRKAYPVMKTVNIWVTPQAKAVEAGQDIVDAVLGVIGVKGGLGMGLVGIAQEMLFRAKWMTKARMELPIKDWADANIIGTLDISFEGTGTTIDLSGLSTESIQRIGTIRDMEMTFHGVSIKQLVDPSKFPAGTVRQQMEEFNQKIREMSVKPSFAAAGPGDVVYSINDSQGMNRRDVGGCGEPTLPTSTSQTTKGRLAEHIPAPSPATPYISGGYSIELQLTARKAKIKFHGPSIPVVIRKSDGTIDRSEWNLLNGLTIVPNNTFTEWELPLKITENTQMEQTNYYGAGPIPFVFGNDYHRNGVVAFSITMKKSAAP